MGRRPSDLDDFLDWQERLESFQASGLTIDVFCLQEGVSRSTFHRWMKQLENGIPKSLLAEKAARKRAKSAEGAAFVPISLKASPVEIELPNGGVVRLPLGVGQAVLVDVIRAVGALRPWKAPQS
jgi:transposase-like protein